MKPASTPSFSLSTTLVVFGAGAILMALEMLAFRLVAKNFGSALREVSAVIAVFLTAMSAGYALGGRVGDWRPSPWTLTVVLVGAGLLTLLIPLIEEPVATAVFDSSLPLGLHAALVAIALFALPACCIASPKSCANQTKPEESSIDDRADLDDDTRRTQERQYGASSEKARDAEDDVENHNSTSEHICLGHTKAHRRADQEDVLTSDRHCISQPKH